MKILSFKPSSRKGATLIEYAILVGGLSLASIFAINLVGKETGSIFEGAKSALALNFASDGSSAGPGPAVTAIECYTTEAPGTIGTYPGCMGMLIVDNDMMQAVGADGSATFSIAGPDSNQYNFVDSQYNIFTGQVTDLERMFYNTSFNGDISYWDTSNVTTLFQTFYESSFNGYIGDWDTSNVNDFQRAFGDTPFNTDISRWDTSSGTDFYAMFLRTRNFNQDISGWDTSSVTTNRMDYMFFEANAFDQDISSWCVSSLSAKPTSFDTNAGFANDAARQPQWGQPCS